MNFHSPIKLCLLSSSSSSTCNLLDRIIFYSLRHNQQLNFCTAKKRVRTTVDHDQIVKEGSRIAKLLRINLEQGIRIFNERHYIAKVKDENILGVMKVLKKFNIPASYVKTCPKLLCAKPVSLASDIAICNEVGIDIFKNLGDETNNCINRYRELKSVPVTTLKTKGLIPWDCDVTKKLVQVLEMDEKTIHKLYDYLPMCHDDLNLKTLRYHILTYYFSSALNCSIRDAQIIINKYGSSEYRSFQQTRDNLNILKTKFLFTNKMILNSDATFKTHADHLLEVYNKVKTLSGQPALQVIQSRPKIIIQRASALLEIQKLILEDYGYPLEALKRRPEIYTLCPKTIKQRLEEMEATPQLKSLKSHPASISLVYYFNKCKRRMEEVHLNKTPYVAPSLHILTTGNINYKRFLESGFKPHGKDLVVVLTKYFIDKKPTQIRNYLSVHPHWIDVPIHEAEGVMNYISSFPEISKDSLYEALPIVLYPIEKVKDCINSTLENGEATLNDSYFLQMVLYFLEKGNHFTGDGIWRGTSTEIPPQSMHDHGQHNSEFDFIFNEADHSDENPHEEDEVEPSIDSTTAKT